MIRIYTYRNCDSCRKALNWLKERGIACEVLPVRETPPTPGELRFAIRARGGQPRGLFNTSGTDYRALGLAARISTMTEEEAVDLLSRNGNLVRRPLLLTDTAALAGFDPQQWDEVLGGG